MNSFLSFKGTNHSSPPHEKISSNIICLNKPSLTRFVDRQGVDDLINITSTTKLYHRKGIKCNQTVVQTLVLLTYMS